MLHHAQTYTDFPIRQDIKFKIRFFGGGKLELLSVFFNRRNWHKLFFYLKKNELKSLWKHWQQIPLWNCIWKLQRHKNYTFELKKIINETLLKKTIVLRLLATLTFVFVNFYFSKNCIVNCKNKKMFRTERTGHNTH